jgi:hypothetical protein
MWSKSGGFKEDVGPYLTNDALVPETCNKIVIVWIARNRSRGEKYMRNLS